MTGIDGARRARSEQAKQERAQRIVDAVRALQSERSFAELTMADVAHRAGVAKGTVFLYFATKEALGLALTQSLLDDWFVHMESALNALAAPADSTTVAHLITDSVDDRPALVRMLALLGTMLEHNIAPATALAFKQRLLDRLDRLGAGFERVLPFLEPGGGARAVLLIHALVVGLQQMAEPAPSVRQALQQPELERLTIELRTELFAALSAYFRGLEAGTTGEGSRP